MANSSCASYLRHLHSSHALPAATESRRSALAKLHASKIERKQAARDSGHTLGGIGNAARRGKAERRHARAHVGSAFLLLRYNNQCPREGTVDLPIYTLKAQARGN